MRRKALWKQAMVVFGVAVTVLVGAGCGGGSGGGLFSDAIDLSHVGTIQGTVTDARTGEPVAGAIVTTQGQSSITDSQGAYRVGDDLRTGWYDVVVSAEGYQLVERGVEIEIYTIVDFPLAPET